MNFAPIALFVYNRPEHTEKTLDLLSKNIFADSSILYIFSDGPKNNATSEDLEKIYKTRELLKSKQWCKEVVIKEGKTNLGLANSIISGVTELVNHYGSVIVLEDDIIVGNGFLKYMNEALEMYKNNSLVGCIHGWNYNLEIPENANSSFFLRGADCWGWATWRRAWDIFEPDGKKLLKIIKLRKNEFDFDRRGTHNYCEMLEDQINGKNDSWAIRFHASLYLAGKFCLHPSRSLVKNIGLDNSGTHCGSRDLFQEFVDYIELVELPVLESEWFFDSFLVLQKKANSSKSKWQKLKTLIKFSLRYPNYLYFHIKSY